MPDKIIADRTAFEGFFDVHVLTIEQANGEIVEREMVDQKSGAVVLPFDKARKMAMLISEHRHPLIFSNGPVLLEPIAGEIEGVSPKECARSEALEEAGIKLDRLDHVASCYTSPGTTTEQIHLYLASYTQADLVGEGGGLAEENEKVAIIELPLARLWTMYEARELRDTRTILLLFALKLRHPQLFE